MTQRQYYISTFLQAYRPNQWDAIIFIGTFAIFAVLASAAAKMDIPYRLGENLPISLDPSMLPSYALRTVIRMFIAMFFALLFSICVGTLAGKYRLAERIIIPILDILQSVPILGYLSITVVAFIALFPNSLMGPECAAIFAIFTSQAWNTAFCIYQSFKTLPIDLSEAADMYRLSAWQRFWRLEMPYAAPVLLWNMMMSMSAGWFFLVAAEAISVSNQEIYLPGIGSYIAIAIKDANIMAVFYAIFAMLVVIVVYDQLLFRPLIKWTQKFSMDTASSENEASSWVLSLFRRARLFHGFNRRMDKLITAFINIRWFIKKPPIHQPTKPIKSRKNMHLIEDILPLIMMCVGLYALGVFVLKSITYQEVLHVFFLGGITAMRVMVMVFIASIIWVPIGIWVGMRPRVRQIVQPIAQFFAAFPANLLFPVFVIFIVKYHLNVNIWTTPLMIVGTQWYILFNVIAGTISIPQDLWYVTQNFGIKRWLWWKRFALPAIFPCYVTGALTAAGGSWNASIVAEVVNWGDTKLVATGLGAYITEYTTVGDFHRIFLGIGVMSIYVVTFNVVFWQRLYTYARTRFQSN